MFGSCQGINAFLKEEQREKALTEKLLQLQHAELQLGLPQLEIDHHRGVCCLGDVPRTGELQNPDVEMEALRSIKVNFDEERLRKRMVYGGSTNTLQKDLTFKIYQVCTSHWRIWFVFFDIFEMTYCFRGGRLSVLVL